MTIREDVRAELSWKSAFRIAWAIVIVNAFLGVLILIALFVFSALVGGALFHSFHP